MVDDTAVRRLNETVIRRVERAAALAVASGTTAIVQIQQVLAAAGATATVGADVPSLAGAWERAEDPRTAAVLEQALAQAVASLARPSSETPTRPVPVTPAAPAV